MELNIGFKVCIYPSFSLKEHEQHAKRDKIFLDCILSFQTEEVSEYQLWVLSGKEDGAYPLIGE